ncbi:MAG: HNH endonuclease [Desulfobacterales bacterium]|nr:HNH endonuclease [Desulfobacterales bacterium]
MRTQQYGITHLHLGEVDVAVEGVATVQILQVDVQNHYSQDSINFAKRMEHVRRVWEKRGSFDETVSRLIAQHEELIRIDSPLPTKILSVVRQLQKLMADTGHDYGIIPNTRTTDVLPSLLEILDLPQPSAAGVEAGEISADEVVIRLRHIKNERRLANLRGASSVRFRRDVRTAYRATCVVCGLHLPPIGPGGSPGVDAAHILPWSAFDVDHVSNGLCLCKLHHWAFDESLIEFTLENGVYSVLIPDEAVARVEKYSSTFDLSFLKENTGVISDARLPRKIQDRPKPEFLKALKEFLSQS